MHSQGVGVVTEDGAGAAHMDGLHTSVNAARAVQRMVVSAALGLGVPPQPDVAILAPAGAPAVPDNVVITIRVGAVAHKLDGVVESNVGGVLAAIIDTAVVSSPAAKIPR